MTQEEILQYNKMCAEFLGVTLHESQLTMPHSHFTGYHSDWNWIHEVVEAILKVQNPKKHSDTTCSTFKREIEAHLGRTKKEATVEAINQFLIWYEQNKTI